MERLNRTVQRNLLVALAEHYPAQCQPFEVGYEDDDPNWNVNLHYLYEHGLVTVETHQFQDQLSGPQVHLATITAKGLDFLQDDGGLSAILNVVTVRFEAETLRALIDAKVDASDAPAEQKSAIKKKLGELSSEALKELTKRLVAEGLAHWPQALQLLERAIAQAS